MNMKNLGGSVIGFSVLLVAVAPAESARTTTHGFLLAYDEDHIFDTELEELISTHITTYESMILAFTECYAGDMLDDFTGYANTALLSATLPGKTANYLGYHRGLVWALVPGNTTDAAHQSGVAAHVAAGAYDSPWKLGPNLTVGGTSSTHVLVYMGERGGLGIDHEDMLILSSNFSSDPPNSVTLLADRGRPPPVDGPATRQALADALATIGAQMDENAQFILFVGDHGGLMITVMAMPCNDTCSTMLDSPVYEDMIADANNQPLLTVVTSTYTDLTCFEAVEVNGYSLALPTADDVFELDYDDDGTPDAYKYIMEVSEWWLLPEDNEVNFDMASSCGTIEFDRVSLESGGISRTTTTVHSIPAASQWGLIALAVSLCAVAATVLARQRKTTPA